MNTKILFINPNKINISNAAVTLKPVKLSLQKRLRRRQVDFPPFPFAPFFLSHFIFLLLMDAL